MKVDLFPLFNLTAEEIHSEIMRRGDLLKEKYPQKIKNEDTWKN